MFVGIILKRKGNIESLFNESENIFSRGKAFEKFQCSQILERIVKNNVPQGVQRLPVFTGIDHKGIARGESVVRGGCFERINGIL